MDENAKALLQCGCPHPDEGVGCEINQLLGCAVRVESKTACEGNEIRKVCIFDDGGTFDLAGDFSMTCWFATVAYN